MMAKNRDKRFKDAAEMVKAIKKLQKSRKSSAAVMGLDVTGAMPSDVTKQKKTQTLNILLLLMITSGGILGTLQYAQSKIEDTSPKIENVPINADLPDDVIPAIVDEPAQAESSNTAEAQVAVSDDVVQALHWLGKKSLEDYRLTSPAEDNAYYYYSRLLEADPGDKVATVGLLNIADRYAYLADRSFLENDYGKAEAYTSIGLKFNPNHIALIKLKELTADAGEKSFMERLKNLFSG
jgi:hypothetical protein